VNIHLHSTLPTWTS